MWTLWDIELSAGTTLLFGGCSDGSAHLHGKIWVVVSGCQNHGPFLGTLHTRCRSIIGIQKGTIILTTTHIAEILRICYAEGHGQVAKSSGEIDTLNPIP